MQAVRERFGAKERAACRWLDINRKLLHYESTRNDELLRLRLVELAREHCRYGLPRLTVLLRREGISDNHKRIARIYRAANLQVRKRVRRKLALGRGPATEVITAPNERWSLDFVHDRLRNNRRFRILAVGDDCTRENLARSRLRILRRTHDTRSRCDRGTARLSQNHRDGQRANAKVKRAGGKTNLQPVENRLGWLRSPGRRNCSNHDDTRSL